MSRIIDFSKYSSIKIGTPIKVDVMRQKEPLDGRFLIGGANNLLVSPTPPPLVVLGKEFEYIQEKDGLLKVGGATKSGKIFSYCKKRDIGGLEFLGKLPGTLGGLVKMNAGMKAYEIFNHLVDITLFSGVYKKEEIEFGYRFTNINEPIFEATFEIKKGFDYTLLDEFTNMRKNQPKEPSAGSVFKNPNGDFAGRLIEAVGLKGKRVGGAMWSKVHANFLVNIENATFDDAYSLIKEAKEKVLDRFDIKLKEEIIIL